MKKHLRFLSLVLVLVMIALPLVSCTKTGTSTDTETVAGTNEGPAKDTQNDAAKDTEAAGPEQIYTTILSNIAEYVVVRPDIVSDDLKASIDDLMKKIKKETKAELEMATEYDVKVEYEILIGDLARNDSKAVNDKLRYNDYVVKLVGNKLIIAGGCEEKLLTAIDEFKNNFIVAGMVLAPTGKGIAYEYDYSFDSISINGKPVSEYKIYSTNMDCTERLADHILKKFSGETVKTYSAFVENQGPYIVLEPNSMDYTHYKAELRDGNLYVSGSYKACYEFLDYFVKQGIKDVNITEGFEGDIDTPEFYTKDELMYVLEKAYNTQGRVIIGQEALGGIRPYVLAIESFRNATNGSDPGIIGIDLGWAGMCLYKPMRGQPQATDEIKSQVFCEIVEYAEMGGIITIGSHFNNPNDAGKEHLPENQECRGFLGKEDAFASLITPGTEFNKNFQAELDACIEWLSYLQEIGVPAIYRPLHEMSTSSFWWGMQQSWADGSMYTIESEAFVNLWKYVYNQFETAGLDNLLWLYCPDSYGVGTMAAYPGDEYCDIVGTDWYTNGKLEIAGPGGRLAQLMKAGKPVVIGEMGHWGAHDSSMDYVKDLRTMLVDQGLMLSYTMTWTAQHTFEKLGDGEAAIKSGIFICRDELVDWFAEARAALRGNE